MVRIYFYFYFSPVPQVPTINGKKRKRKKEKRFKVGEKKLKTLKYRAGREGFFIFIFGEVGKEVNERN